MVDMQGQHLPAERIEKGPFVAHQRQEHVAYISNLAVSPAARRLGVGEKLLKAAEKVRRSCPGFLPVTCSPHAFCCPVKFASKNFDDFVLNPHSSICICTGMQAVREHHTSSARCKQELY